MRRLCTICARGGSKGVPAKNIRSLMGKPLLVHSIHHAKASGQFERIAVSSDSGAILEIARSAGADDLIDRPPQLATDCAGKVPAIHHALLSIEERHGLTFDTLVDLDVTSPLRTTDDIVGAIRLLEANAVSSVITGSVSHRSPYFNLVEETACGSVEVAKRPPATVLRRQDVPRTFDMNASIYVWQGDAFRRDPKVFYADTRLYEMPSKRSLDIDSEFDFELVEMLLRHQTGALTRSSARFDLGGKVAVITGGAGLLGRHFARGLAEHGAIVAIIDLDANAVALQAETLRSEIGSRALGIPCDITDPLAVKEAIAHVECEFGEIDILHNNAATKGRNLEAFFAADEDYALETWREIMSVNLDAMFVMAQEVGRRMIARKRGSIIQTASIYGIMGPDPRIYEGSHFLGRAINTPAIYSASKAGVLGLTRHLATTWAVHNVRVNALTPGGVESGQNATFSEKYSSRVPLGRMARPDDMVGALVFLASDASNYVTGQNMVVDGGLSAW